MYVYLHVCMSETIHRQYVCLYACVRKVVCVVWHDMVCVAGQVRLPQTCHTQELFCVFTMICLPLVTSWKPLLTHQGWSSCRGVSQERPLIILPRASVLKADEAQGQAWCRDSKSQWRTCCQELFKYYLYPPRSPYVIPSWESQIKYKNGNKICLLPAKKR